ncbi:choline transporter-like protein 2 isoform X2 [Mercenaria mercenaria]|uniref:choline transporter-like protein 2 isoform X2 n=1 Tax=Mercenaria mercenaria TaxID=6596 RepID=UPI00234EE568|nr:choline transporter-like protein 2 isoform X2 [Mercenaria mercenaria]
MCGGNQVDDDESSGEKYGKPKEHKKDFKGPIKNRSCTDIICCLLFVICVTGMVVVSAVGFGYGDPKKLVYPTDSDGNMCGVGDYASKPYLAYFDILQCTKVGVYAIAAGCPTPSVCVASCPSTYWVYLELEALVTLTTATTSDYDKLLCKNSVTDAQTLIVASASVGTKVKDTVIDTDLCAAYYVPTTDLVGRCIPSVFIDGLDYAATMVSSSGSYNLTSKDGIDINGDVLNTASQYLAKFYALKNYAELVFKDCINAWWLILACLGGAAVFCFIWIILLRFIAGIIVWATLVLFLGVWAFGTYYSFDRYYYLKNNGNPAEQYDVAPLFAGEFNYYLGLKKTWLAFACTCSTLLLIFLLIFLFLVKRICIAIELIKESSRAIGNMIFTLIWPVFPFLMQLAFFAYYVVSAAYVASMGASQFYNNATNTTDDGGVTYYLKRAPCDVNDQNTGEVCEFVKYGGDEYTIPLEVFLLFMFFWGMNFIVALGQMTLAGAFASYYWAFEKPKDIPAFPLTGSIYRSLRFHMGSLAFGSLLIAIVQMIRVFLEYLDHKLKGSGNAVAKFFLKCLKCCMWCLEKFLRFLNKNAYILIAIYGKNFCASAKDAFFLIMRNVVRVVVLDKVTDFVLFISKLLCVSAVGVASFFFFNGDISYLSEYVPKLNYFFTPVILVVLGTYLIASCFFSVYSMAVDTLFLCFLEDLEMNDGTPEKPYYMSKGLMKIIGKKNKQLKEPGGNSRKKSYIHN